MILARRPAEQEGRHPGRRDHAARPTRHVAGLLLVALGGCAAAALPPPDDAQARSPGRSACARALLREADEVWNRGKLSVIPEIVRDSAVIWFKGSRAVVTHGDYRRVVTDWRTAFPDLVRRVDDVVVEGDRVASRTTTAGTHLGSFYGIPPTGRRISVAQMNITRCENGVVVEGWLVEETDQDALMEQLRAPDRRASSPQ